MTKTIRLTMAQALTRFLSRQMTVIDGKKVPVFGRRLGHLRPWQCRRSSARRCIRFAKSCRPYRAHNEQAMAHAAIAFAKATFPPAA